MRRPGERDDDDDDDGRIACPRFGPSTARTPACAAPSRRTTDCSLTRNAILVELHVVD